MTPYAFVDIQISSGKVSVIKYSQTYSMIFLYGNNIPVSPVLEAQYT